MKLKVKLKLLEKQETHRMRLKLKEALLMTEMRHSTRARSRKEILKEETNPLRIDVTKMKTRLK